MRWGVLCFITGMYPSNVWRLSVLMFQGDSVHVKAGCLKLRLRSWIYLWMLWNAFPPLLPVKAPTQLCSNKSERWVWRRASLPCGSNIPFARKWISCQEAEGGTHEVTAHVLATSNYIMEIRGNPCSYFRERWKHRTFLQPPVAGALPSLCQVTTADIDWQASEGSLGYSLPLKGAQVVTRVSREAAAFTLTSLSRYF